MTSPSSPPSVGGPIEALLAALGVDLRAEGPGASAFAEARLGPEGVEVPPEAQRVGAEGALAVLVRGRPHGRELARVRERLWPAFHAAAVVRRDGSGLVLESLGGREPVAGELPPDAALLLLRRRELALAPEATVSKFDANATGWNGDPGRPGYAHHRWMRRFVGTFWPAERRPRRVLDFGCGAGWVGIEAALRAPGAALCAFDPSPEMVRIATANARAVGIRDFEARTGFGEEPPYPEADGEPFDLVLSSGVISFARDHERFLDGLARAVAPGGTLVVGDASPQSRGMRRRRAERPLLPLRELAARRADEVERALERRGFRAEARAGYQLTRPVAQLVHASATRLGGVLDRPLVGLNAAAAALSRRLRGRPAGAFDSWVVRLRRS